MSNNRYMKLFATCIPVKGARRSIICDLQRQKYSFIPNALHELLTSHDKKSIPEIKNFYQNKYDDTIDEYFNFLETKEYAFHCSQKELELFPPLNLEWNQPQVISNAIIDCDSNSKHNYNDIFLQLDSLHCTHLQIRCFSVISKQKIIKILKLLDRSGIINVELICPVNKDLNQDIIWNIIADYPRLNRIYLYNNDKFHISKKPKNQISDIIYLKEQIKNEYDCGNICHKTFIINQDTFIESQQHNSCLNGKVSIDKKGYIKNCPAFVKNYGNITDTKIKDAVQTKEFQKYWHINKDQIETCKDCEFRYICTDCRAITSNPNNILSKPLKCPYDPYTAKGF